MAHQRLHSSQRHRIPRQPQIPQELERRRLTPTQLERKHRARKIALRLINSQLLGVVEQGRIQDLLQLGMLREPFRDPLRVLARPIHPKSHSRQASVQHPALVRLQYVAEKTPQGPHLLDQCRIAGQRHAADQIAEARKVFGGGVQHHVRAQ